MQQPTNIQAESAALKKELGLRDLALTQVLVVVGSAWVGTAAKLGASHTVFWVLAILFFYVPQGLVVIYLNRLMPVEGGLYQWARLGFSPFAGYMVGWNLWLYTIFLVSQLGLILATNLSYAIGPTAAWMSSNKFFITGVTTAVTLLLVLITILGLSVGKWVQNVGGIAQIVTYAALLLIPFLTARHGGLEHYHPLTVAAPAVSLFSLNVFGKMAMGALSGLEYVAILAGETRRPARNMAWSIWIATPMIATMFVLGTDSVLALVPREQVDLVGPVPQVLSIGFRQIGLAGPVASVIILLLAARQIGNCTLAVAGCTRLPMVAGWDHLLPRWFSVLHPRYRTPVNSALFVGAMVLIMGLAGIVGVGHQEAFQLLDNASGIFYGLAYVAMFALPVFGLQRFGRCPLWLRAASASGMIVTALYCVLSIFPIVEVASWFSFSAKISGVILGANGVGVALYLAANRAAESNFPQAPTCN